MQRLVPEELWELFQRVVPPSPTRPQGGGRRRVDDRLILAAIVFVATSGCTWRQLPPVFGASWQSSAPPGRRRIAVSPSGAPPGCGPSSTGSPWTSSAREVSWTGRGARSTRSACERSKRGADRSESCQSRQERTEDPYDHRTERTAHLGGDLRGQHPRQPGLGTAGAWHPGDPLASRAAAAPTHQAARRQGPSTRACACSCADAGSHPGSPTAAWSPASGWAVTAG